MPRGSWVPVLVIGTLIQLFPDRSDAVLEREDPASQARRYLSCYQSLNRYPGGEGATLRQERTTLTAIPTEPAIMVKPADGEGDTALTYLTQPRSLPEAVLFREIGEGPDARLEVYRARTPEDTRALVPFDDILHLGERHYLLKLEFEAPRRETVPLAEWPGLARLEPLATPLYLDLERSTLGPRATLNERAINPFAPRIEFLSTPAPEAVPELEQPDLYTAVVPERVALDGGIEALLLESIGNQLGRIISARLSDHDPYFAPDVARQRDEAFASALAVCEEAGLGPTVQGALPEPTAGSTPELRFTTLTGIGY